MSPTMLLEPFQIRELTLRNRIVVSPMCQYGAQDGTPNDWHLVHLGRFAIGGAGLIVTESTGVEPAGRISNFCTGLWSDAQAAAWRRITDFVHSQNSAICVQLGHAGRKASSRPNWEGGAALKPADSPGPWDTVAPSAVAHPDMPVPHALTTAQIAQQVGFWRDAARRADDAGFDAIEVHGASGYLLHQFQSALSNFRTDAYGGDAAGRMRFPLEVVEAIRSMWPSGKPLFYRVSAIDGLPGGITLEDTIAFARELKARGVDVIDCSAGLVLPGPRDYAPGYMVPFAEAVRKGSGALSMAVGFINEPRHAEDILQAGQADLIALGRAMLADPNWAVRAKKELDPEAGFDAYPPRPRFWLKARQDLLARLGIPAER